MIIIIIIFSFTKIVDESMTIILVDVTTSCSCSYICNNQQYDINSIVLLMCVLDLTYVRLHITHINMIISLHKLWPKNKLINHHLLSPTYQQSQFSLALPFTTEVTSIGLLIRAGSFLCWRIAKAPILWVLSLHIAILGLSALNGIRVTHACMHAWQQGLHH